MTINPLLDFRDLPRFDEVRPEHVLPAIDQLIDQAEAAVKAAESVSSLSWETFVTPLDDATERLNRAWGQVGHLQAVVNTPELRQAYNENLPKIVRFGSALGQNLALFAQYRKLAGSSDFATYDDARRKTLANALRDFRLSGAELSEEGRTRFAAIQQELSALSALFSENVLDATESFALFVKDASELVGIPTDVLLSCRDAAEKASMEGWKIGLQAPVLVAVLTYCDNRQLRETVYRANGLRASEAGPAELDNSCNIRRILELRHELAHLLGLPSYAHYSLATKMAQSPDEVLAFLRNLAAKAMPSAKADRGELEHFARTHVGIEFLEPWDIAYVSEKLRQARYSVSTQEVKDYFTEPKVLAGLFEVVQDLYNVKIEPDSAPVWHEDVRFFRVLDARNVLVGQFYMDLYARDGKRGGAWMDDCRNHRKIGNQTQTPVVLLTCNFGKSADGNPATFSHDDVITLFHEMGHGLHQLLTRIGELSVAGINGVEWDAVELPSQFMENFCWEWARLLAMTSHVDSGASLPRYVYDRMIAARNFQSGMRTLRQIELSLFDMRLHAADFDLARDDFMALLERVRDEVAVNRAPAWHRFPQTFTHIFAGGYAAGYYSYKWAEVLSADAYAAFEDASQFGEIGKRFLDEVLSRGGSRTAVKNFEAFRGRPPTVEALLRVSGLQ